MTLGICLSDGRGSVCSSLSNRNDEITDSTRTGSTHLTILSPSDHFWTLNNIPSHLLKSPYKLSHGLTSKPLTSRRSHLRSSFTFLFGLLLFLCAFLFSCLLVRLLWETTTHAHSTTHALPGHIIWRPPSHAHAHTHTHIRSRSYHPRSNSRATRTSHHHPRLSTSHTLGCWDGHPNIG
ncbi:hypothetical protein BC629DRAFT_1473913 [Irpex lacteus]|nr:hypothetical protein BC629DRAFT_1473913 [Irpex lacteus]